MAQLTQWALPPAPPIFGVRLLTTPWRGALYFSRADYASFFQLVTSGTPRVREWMIPYPLQGVLTYKTWVDGLTIDSQGAAWACLGQNTDGRLVRLLPGPRRITAFYNLPGSPFVAMNDVAMEPGGRVWFAATSTGANHAAIGRLDPATLNAALFELPPECDHPSSLVVERGGGAVWFCCFNWNQLATTGAFLGRLDLGTATLDYWSLPGRGPVCFRIAAAQVATPPDIWFTFYDWPSLGSLPNASRLFRFHVPTSTFYEYGSPTLTQPAHVALDRTASAWMTDRDTVRMVRRGANCGVVAFDHRRARVKARDGRAKADEDVATPATQPAPATVSTVGRTREPCLANYSIAPAAPLGIAVHNPAGSQTNVYYTDGGNNVIGRLVP